MSTDDGRPNAAMRRAWDGPTGDFWADNADRFDRGVAAYREPFLAAAAIAPDDRVLDVGCGAGETTRDAARLASRGHALGVDLSERLLAIARARSTGRANVGFERGDAQTRPFPDGGYDVVVSRHGAMFFDDPVAAFANLARALRPGGRLVLLVWQEIARNEFIHGVLGAMAVDREPPLPPADGPGPVSLADPARVHAVLDAAGFADVSLEGVERPMDLGPTVDEAFAYQCGQHAGLLADMAPGDRARARERLRADLAAHLVPGVGVHYASAAWIVRGVRSP